MCTIYAGLGKVGKVHRYLCDVTIGQLYTHRLAEAETATDVTYSLGNSISDSNIAGIEVYVVGNKRHTSTYSHTTCRSVTICGTEVGEPFSFVHFGFHPFELALSYLGKIFTMRSCCTLFVEVYGYTILSTNDFANLTREGDSFVHFHIADGDEGNYVHSTHTGVLPRVLSHIDYLNSYTHCFEERFLHCFRSTYYGYNKAVMVFVVAIIKQLNALTCTERIYNLLDFFAVASLAKIGYALYNFRCTCHDDLFFSSSVFSSAKLAHFLELTEI